MICDKASKSSKELSIHKYNKYWTRTLTSMEADIIVEGFRQSITMHNLMFQKFFGDGDSSITKN